MTGNPIVQERGEEAGGAKRGRAADPQARRATGLSKREKWFKINSHSNTIRANRQHRGRTFDENPTGAFGCHRSSVDAEKTANDLPTQIVIP